MQAAARNGDTDAENRSSRADVWFMKPIQFKGRETRIITQNFNGPCSLIAICNILILRQDITILPPERSYISYELLSQLLGEYLLANSTGDTDLSAALSIMPSTTKGMDLNPIFTAATSFLPSIDGLQLFEQANISLLHGWLVDPSDEITATVMAKVGDYDSAQNLIVDADVDSMGRLVISDGQVPVNGTALYEQLTDKQRAKISDAAIVRTFLDTTQSQLTYHGLFTLSSHLKPGETAALFRSSHLAVLHRTDEALFTLVTDSAFLHEPTVVWERLEDVDGSGTFVDSDFVISTPIGGDFAGQNPASFAEQHRPHLEDPADEALVRQLQAEEDAYATQWYYNQQQRLQREQLERHRPAQEDAISTYRRTAISPPTKKKERCIIM